MNCTIAASRWWNARSGHETPPSTCRVSCAGPDDGGPAAAEPDARARSPGSARTCSRASATRSSPSRSRYFLYLLVPPIVRFMFIDAVWTRRRTGTPAGPRRRGIPSAPAGPSSSTRSTTSSTAPTRSPERWRVNIFFGCSPSASAGCSGSRRRGATSARSISSSPFRSSSFLLLTGASWLGLSPVPTLALGRHPGDAPDRRDGRHRLLAAASAFCWRSGGARSCRSCKLALGHLHRVRARRAADHRAVHGEHDAAAVPARRHHRRPAAAAPGRHRVLRLRLHGRGGARRPAGDAEGPV